MIADRFLDLDQRVLHVTTIAAVLRDTRTRRTPAKVNRRTRC
jgi:hypothetical protein